MGQYLRSCFRLSTLLLRVSQDTSLMRTKASSSCMTESLNELGQPDGIAQHDNMRGVSLHILHCNPVLQADDRPLGMQPQSGTARPNELD